MKIGERRIQGGSEDGMERMKGERETGRKGGEEEERRIGGRRNRGERRRNGKKEERDLDYRIKRLLVIIFRYTGLAEASRVEETILKEALGVGPWKGQPSHSWK